MDNIPFVTTDTLIIGAGAAGLAVYYGVRSHGGEALLLDERDRPGGILRQCIHNGFGLGVFGEDLTGPEYLARYLERIRSLPGGKERFTSDLLLSTTVISVSPDRTALCTNLTGLFIVRFRQLAVASGCREKPLYSLPVEGPRPEGIYTAGEAQELLNLQNREIGNEIVILGSGDIGQIMARRFSLHGKTVKAVIEKEGKLGGLLRNQKQCLEAFHIPVILRATVTGIHGFPYLSGVTIRHLDTGIEEFLSCDTLVTSLGLIPDRTIAENLRENGSYPSYVHFIGNADHVHEIVDSVTREGEKMGEIIVSQNYEKE